MIEDKIKRCIECPQYEYHMGFPSCKKMNFRELKRFDKIPDWCPLPESDKEEISTNEDALMDRLTYFLFILARDHVVIGSLNQALSTLPIDKKPIFGDKNLEIWARSFATALTTGEYPDWAKRGNND